MSRTATADQQATGVALTYARALLGAAGNEREAVRGELHELVEQVWNKLPQFTAVLSSALVGLEEKAAVVQRAVSGRVSTVVENFLAVLAKHDRLAILPAVVTALDHLADQAAGVIRVTAVTATPLAGEEVNSLQKQLQSVLGGNPQIENTIDPQIIGGFVLRIGDKVYDASLSSQLQRVREQMITRSIHEIQSRRDRFSTTEGN